MTQKPRALILNLFGDYLRYAEGEARLGELVTLLGAFGMEPAAVRVTLSRLRKEGWFTTRREGRETVYVLSPRMMQILVEGRTRIFQRIEEPWRGQWTMVIYQVPEANRSVREALRRDLAWLGFGQLSPSTWLAAQPRFEEAKALAAEAGDATIDVLWAGSGSLAEDRRLAARCWDLAAVDADYRTFIDRYRGMDDPAANAAKPGPQAVVERTALVGDARRLAFEDPMLPLELQPDGWLGREAYELFRRVHAQLAGPANAYVDQVIGGRFATTPPLGI
jgi:phenylacetic acid degradation operon negative regulatory protein